MASKRKKPGCTFPRLFPHFLQIGRWALRKSRLRHRDRSQMLRVAETVHSSADEKEIRFEFSWNVDLEEPFVTVPDMAPSLVSQWLVSRLKIDIFSVWHFLIALLWVAITYPREDPRKQHKTVMWWLIWTALGYYESTVWSSLWGHF